MDFIDNQEPILAGFTPFLRRSKRDRRMARSVLNKHSLRPPNASKSTEQSRQHMQKQAIPLKDGSFHEDESVTTTTVCTSSGDDNKANDGLLEEERRRLNEKKTKRRLNSMSTQNLSSNVKTKQFSGEINGSGVGIPPHYSRHMSLKTLHNLLPSPLRFMKSDSDIPTAMKISGSPRKETYNTANNVNEHFPNYTNPHANNSNSNQHMMKNNHNSNDSLLFQNNKNDSIPLNRKETNSISNNSISKYSSSSYRDSNISSNPSSLKLNSLLPRLNVDTVKNADNNTNNNSNIRHPQLTDDSTSLNDFSSSGFVDSQSFMSSSLDNSYSYSFTDDNSDEDNIISEIPESIKQNIVFSAIEEERKTPNNIKIEHSSINVVYTFFKSLLDLNILSYISYTFLLLRNSHIYLKDLLNFIYRSIMNSYLNLMQLVGYIASSIIPMELQRSYIYFCSKEFRSKWKRRWNRNKGIRKYQHLMDNAVNYDKWRNSAICLDTLLGRTLWRERAESTAYDYRLIGSRLYLLRQLRNAGNIFDIAYFLRSGFIRNFGGMSDMRLFSRSYIGTKYLIEAYIDEIMFLISKIVSYEPNDAPNMLLSSSSSHIPALGDPTEDETFKITVEEPSNNNTETTFTIESAKSPLLDDELYIKTDQDEKSFQINAQSRCSSESSLLSESCEDLRLTERLDSLSTCDQVSPYELANNALDDAGPSFDYFTPKTATSPQLLRRGSSDPRISITKLIEDENLSSLGLPSYPLSVPEFTAYQKLEFFHYSCQSYGCTALHLDGGTSAFFGLTHLGVVKALSDQDLLPKIISGTSIGALIAALICVHTKDELPNLFIKGGIDLSSLRGTTNPNGASLLSVGFISRIVRFLKHGYIYDISLLANCVRDNLGDTTFEEAFHHTGQVLNIIVTPKRVNEVPTLLNYLTAPNVVIWSAACASAAHLGLYESIDLLAKDSSGNINPWFPSHVDWSPERDAHDHISPMARLAALFNVNHFIVSETSPLGSMFNLYSCPQEPPTLVAKLISFIASECELKLYQLTALGILGRLSPFLFSSYERKVKQTCISIGPSFTFSELLQFFSGKIPTMAKTSKPNENSNDEASYVDRDYEFFSYFMLKGEQATWPFIAAIDVRTVIERALYSACTKIKRNIELHKSSSYSSMRNSPTKALSTRSAYKPSNKGSISTTALSNLRYKSGSKEN